MSIGGHRAGLLALGLMVGVAGCDGPPADAVPGYVEGDFLYLQAEHAGRIVEMPVVEGTAVAAGALLFRQESSVEEAALAAAEASASEARAHLADLLAGARPERLAILEADVRLAKADLELASRRLERRKVLAADTAVSQETLDEAIATHDGASARLEEAQGELALAAMSDRDDRIAEARAAIDVATAEADQQRRTIDEYTVRTPVAGLVHDILRRIGELAPAGGTVMLLLPDDARRAVFFVPETRLAELRLGQPVGITCDGCPDDLVAPIDFIAREVEFTPPVMFGPEQRQRLVVRVEAAIPPAYASILKPGQPITVGLDPVEGAGRG